MKLLRWLGIGLGGLIGLLLALTLVARFVDGGIAIFPGGALEAGELVEGPEPDGDWEFARDIREMTFQLVEPEQSRTIWSLVHEGRLFIVSGYMKTPVGRFWKKWPAQAERDGRCVIRIDGKRYERQAVRIHDPELGAALAAEAERKYGVAVGTDAITTEEVWGFELLPR